MASPTNPTASDAPGGAVSKTTISVAGLDLDIFGLSELSAETSYVSCLWLHHGRGRRKEDMADVAEIMVSGYLNQQRQHHGGGGSQRGLIAIAFDQRNHGTRMTSKLANRTWRSGNSTHAQDMFSQVTGTVVDTMHLMDVLEGYLWLEHHHHHHQDEEKKEQQSKTIDQHLVLGVSMGGHCAWQLLFEDPRFDAGVVVIGCPDYMRLMTNRATSSKLPSTTLSSSSSFIGSSHFPPALVNAAKRWDPKARIFGTEPVPAAAGSQHSSSSSSSHHTRAALDRTAIRGKKIQVLSGGKDNLVPYAAGEAFLNWFKGVSAAWYGGGSGEEGDGNVVSIEDNLYPEAGHEFSEEMKRDAVRFVVDVVASRDGEAPGGRKPEQRQQRRASPKI
ncbi:hypothetical protein Micbo1qcDRAFT_197703 [Microdochium bolleyi]|uniref:Alpha/Beta hydrolase protein n=1 Tax=Microdochium bolleyi TaxID=196109 RepID=A0A136IS61_9PEZI|nr:hypothetical protein Micbo1qcDRAFT_197703 [Microdochium bolleyi]